MNVESRSGKGRERDNCSEGLSGGSKVIQGWLAVY
jgi:hypothetical protein